MRLLSILLLSGCLQLAHGQSTSPQGCNTLWQNYVATLVNLEAPSGNTTYYARMQISTFPKKDSPYAESAYSSENIEVSTLVAREKLYYESTYLNLYRDPSYTVLVIRPRKQVIVQENGPDDAQNPQKIDEKSLANIKQDYLKTCKVVSCKQVTLDGKNLHEMRLEPSDEYKDKMNMLYVVVWLDSKNNQLYKQAAYYNSQHTLDRQEIIFKEVKKDYKGKVPGSALLNVFDKNNNLLPAYQGYTVQR